MTRPLLTCAVAALLSASGASLGAQAPEPPPDGALLRRADSLTVGEYCRFAQRILADQRVVQALADDANGARASAAVICNPLLSSFSLLALTGRAPAPLSAVARVRTNVYHEAQRGILDAMGEFRSAVANAALRPVVRSSLGADNAAFVRLRETAQDLDAAMARDRALTRLANYERKLGPTSARLNGAEVVLNYAAQRWIPGFKPTPLRGPSPLEVVASYAPGYVTVVRSIPTPVSVSEFGLRWYLFGERFGRAGAAGVLFPSYASLGVITASDDNGALVWPWKGRDRSGVFASWGSLKVGYIDRVEGRWLVSKQFQAVPFVF